MFIEITGANVFSLRKGSKVFFKGANGVIELRQFSEETATYHINQVGNQSFTHWSASVGLIVSKDEMGAIISNAPTFVRIETTEGDFDYQFKPNQTQKIVDVIACIERIIPQQPE